MRGSISLYHLTRSPQSEFFLKLETHRAEYLPLKYKVGQSHQHWTENKTFTKLNVPDSDALLEHSGVLDAFHKSPLMTHPAAITDVTLS